MAEAQETKNDRAEHETELIEQMAHPPTSDYAALSAAAFSTSYTFAPQRRDLSSRAEPSLFNILFVAHYHISVEPGPAPPRFIATRLIFYALPTRFRLHNGRSSPQPITKLPAVCPLFETAHHTCKTEDRPIQSS